MVFYIISRTSCMYRSIAKGPVAGAAKRVVYETTHMPATNPMINATARISSERANSIFS